jgi:hypothetical protein
MNRYYFYMFPITSLPSTPEYKIWFAAWTSEQPTAYWWDTRPNVTPDEKSTWVVAVVQVTGNPLDTAGLGPDIIPLGNGTKELPPPPMQLPPGEVGVPAFIQAFREPPTKDFLERREITKKEPA